MNIVKTRHYCTVASQVIFVLFLYINATSNMVLTEFADLRLTRVRILRCVTVFLHNEQAKLVFELHTFI